MIYTCQEKTTTPQKNVATITVGILTFWQHDPAFRYFRRFAAKWWGCGEMWTIYYQDESAEKGRHTAQSNLDMHAFFSLTRSLRLTKNW